jgi:uncharacterized coiled-coil DUF342 family protein
MERAMNEMAELRDRVKAKRSEIEAKLLKARADARGQGRDQVKKLEHKLEELEEELKGGWDNLSEGIAARLNKWLRD